MALLVSGAACLKGRGRVCGPLWHSCLFSWISIDPAAFTWQEVSLVVFYLLGSGSELFSPCVKTFLRLTVVPKSQNTSCKSWASLWVLEVAFVSILNNTITMLAGLNMWAQETSSPILQDNFFEIMWRNLWKFVKSTECHVTPISNWIKYSLACLLNHDITRFLSIVM